VSTGIEALDAVLGGLYRGDNVVWQLDSAPVGPFYRAVADVTETFESRTFVSFGTDADIFDGHLDRRRTRERTRRPCRPPA
jgi:hypothetical protein